MVKFSPNAEAEEVNPWEHVVSTHKNADVSYGHILRREIKWQPINQNKTCETFSFFHFTVNMKSLENCEVELLLETEDEMMKWMRSQFPALCEIVSFFQKLLINLLLPLWPLQP